MKTLIIFETSLHGTHYGIVDDNQACRFHGEYMSGAGPEKEIDAEMIKYFYDDNGNLKDFMKPFDDMLTITGPIQIIHCGDLP